MLFTLDHITKRIPQKKKKGKMPLLWPRALKGHCSIAISAHCYSYKVMTSVTLPKVTTLKVIGSKADPTKTDTKLAVDYR